MMRTQVGLGGRKKRYKILHTHVHAHTTQQRDIPCAHALAIYLCEGDHPLPDLYKEPLDLFSPLYSLGSMVKGYGKVPLMKDIPPLKIDTSILPPRECVEPEVELPDARKRAAAKAGAPTMGVEEMYLLGAPLTLEGEDYVPEYVAGLAAGAGEEEQGLGEGEGEEGSDGGGSGGGGEGGGGSGGGEGGAGGDPRLGEMARISELLDEEMKAGGEGVSYAALVKGMSAWEMATVTWMLRPLQRRESIVLKRTVDNDIIIHRGRRPLLGIRSDEVEEEELALEHLKEQLVQQARRQQQQRRQEGRQQQQGGDGGKKPRGKRGDSCSVCKGRKVKCGVHHTCLKVVARAAAAAGGGAGEEDGEGAAGMELGEEEEEEGQGGGAAGMAAAAAAAQAAAAEEEDEEDEEASTASSVAAARGGGRARAAPRPPPVLWMLPEEAQAFAASLPTLPPPLAPREVFKRAGGGKMGPRKMKRIPNAGSQPSQSQASQFQASQGW